MKSRRIKSAFYILMDIPMRISGGLYKKVMAPNGNRENVRVHIGPGQEKYLDDWINVDANFMSADIDVWADLRNGIPFRENSVDVFYSHHVIEHLPNELLPAHFQEMYRCLKPGGIFRVGGPNGRSAAKKYVEGDKEWFGDFPNYRESIGGRFDNFIFCGGEHFTLLTPSYLEELAEDAGFPKIEVCAPVVETHHPDLIGPEVLEMEYESTPDTPHTLIVEGQKPERSDG